MVLLQKPQCQLLPADFVCFSIYADITIAGWILAIFFEVVAMPYNNE